MKKFIKNNLGFTLAEVLIAAGLAGLVALVAYTTLRSSQTVVGNSLANAEITFMKNQMISYLGIPENCERNFVGKLVQSPVQVPAYILFLEKRNRTTVAGGQDTFTWDRFIEVDRYYGESSGAGGAGTSNTMLIKSIDTAPSPVNPNSMIITVGYEIRSTLKKTGTTTGTAAKFSIEIFIAKNGAVVRTCATDVYTMIRKAIEFSCKGNRATYNPSAGTYGTCTHNNIRVVNSAAATVVGPNSVCPAGEFLYKIETTDGDVPPPVSPAIAPPGRSTYTCRKYTTISDLPPAGPNCPANSFMKSIRADGTTECITMGSFYRPLNDAQVITPNAGTFREVKVGCTNANEVLTRVDPNTGVPTCVPKLIVGSCPVNEYIVGINTNGSPKCAAYPKISGTCPAGQYVLGVTSDGGISSCGAPVLPLSNGCNTGDYVIDWIYSDGSVRCALNN